MEVVSHSPNQTKKMAASLLAHFKGGDAVGLKGELGSGKTVFVQGLGEALRVKQSVTSPTFVILQLYPVNNHPSIRYLCHIDAYRLRNKGDALSAGLADYLKSPDTLCVIEWPENIKELLPLATKIIEFEHIDENTRRIKLKNKKS